MEYEEKGINKWSLGANPKILKGGCGRETVKRGERYLIFRAHRIFEAVF